MTRVLAQVLKKRSRISPISKRATSSSARRRKTEFGSRIPVGPYAEKFVARHA